MEKILARDLLKQTTQQLWQSLSGRFILVFDDGELVTNHKETKYTSYAWDFFRKYPGTPILKKHHLREVLKNTRLSPKTHLKLLGNVVWTIHDTFPDVDLDQIAREVYLKTNEMYNDLSIRLEEYAGSIDILDFIQALDTPAIKDSNNNLEPNPVSIDKNYQTILNSLATDPVLRDNPLAKAGRSGIVNSGQLLQCLGARGYLTDTDSSQFQVPVLRGYTDGIRLFHDSLIESRSAAKSLLFSKKPLQDAEYFSRRLQLMDQIVKNLHKGDCGSTDYLIWTVRDKEYDENGKEIYSGDLPRIVGKHYLDADGHLKTIGPNDHHLIGKSLKFRNVLSCRHPDPFGICSTCFGALANTVPANSNIGHMCCTSLTQKSSQNVLSVKHLDTTCNVESVQIHPSDRRYLSPGTDGSSYHLEKSLKGKIKLVISAKEATNITDIREVKNVEDLNIHRVSAMTEIGIIIDTGKMFEQVSISVGLERRLASMSYALLEHIRQKGWEIDQVGNYVIDMEGWDRNKSILVLPLRHYNMSDHSRDIAALLESTVKDLKKRDKVVSPVSILNELYELVNSKLEVNLAILEVVIYGIMIVSAEKMDYHLPKPWTESGVGVKTAIMAFRSLSASMAYQAHRSILTNPLSFLVTDRPDHVLDQFLLPEEASGRGV